MIRQLLTLVAILTGLTALSAPAQARISAVDEVHVQATRDVAISCPHVQGTAPAVRNVPAGMARQIDICPRPQIAFAAPSVMLRADRAHE